MNKSLLISIIILIILIYLNYNLKYNNEFQLLQLSSNKITQNILYEKSPIVVQDNISNIIDFIHVILTYEYIFKNKVDYKSSNYVNKNLALYSLIYNSNSKPINVYISHPKNSKKFKSNKLESFNYIISDYKVNDVENINDTQFVKITLKPKKLLVLPAYWLFYIDNNCQIYSLFGLYNILIALFKGLV
jgi:hypothetical protein